MNPWVLTFRKWYKARQLVIVALFVGLAGGQLVSGPASDTAGRRPMIFIGVAVLFFRWNRYRHDGGLSGLWGEHPDSFIEC